MGLLLSLIISYAGVVEAIETIKHILSGVVPDTEPDFRDLVEYYSIRLRKTANPSPPTAADWTRECGQGYLCLNEDENLNLKSAAIKYYDGQSDSTAILFSTKISSFGQESIEENNIPHANGDYQTNGDCRSERYIPTKTKTIIAATSESYNVGMRNRSPTSIKNVSDPNHFSANSSERDEDDTENSEAKEKLTWHYRPLSPTPQAQTLPDIHFQSFDENEKGVYSDEFLRSLDGIKFRPLQRSDPSGRRRSFKKRHSSSSNSSRESRASREEELKMFTSLEEAEFERMNEGDTSNPFGSTPNLAPRSYSRSGSRENSRERRNESWSVDASADNVQDDEFSTEKPTIKDLPKLNSFEDEKEKVTEEEEEVDDFWGNSGD